MQWHCNSCTPTYSPESPKVLQASRDPEVSIKDCAATPNNRAIRCLKLSAIHVTTWTIFERLISVPGPCGLVQFVTMPSAPTPPPLTSKANNLSEYNLWPQINERLNWSINKLNSRAQNPRFFLLRRQLGNFENVKVVARRRIHQKKKCFKVGLGISRTNADSQWNSVYNAFHRFFCCWNETIRR